MKKQVNKKPNTKPATETRIRKAQIKKQKFAEEWVASGGDGAKAARAAGSKAKNASIAAAELLNDDETQAEIRKMAEESRSRKVLTARETLERISEQATFDPSPYRNKDGSIDLEKLMRDGKGHLIAGYASSCSPTGITRTQVFFYSHQKALFQLVKCFGLEQAAKPNEFDVVRRGVQSYMQTNQCDLQTAIDALSQKYPMVARYAGQLLEQGVMPS